MPFEENLHLKSIACKLQVHSPIVRVDGREAIMTNLKYELQNQNIAQYITQDDAELILKNYGYKLSEIMIENIEVNKASEDKILGFVADHLGLKITVILNNERIVHSFFVKAVSKENESKAAMIKDFNMFETELKFYKVIKSKIDLSGLPAWSARFIANLEDEALVFEDLMQMQYKMHSKHLKFDMNHTLEALKTLARFHATSLIFEERMTKDRQKPYRLHVDYAQYLCKGPMEESNPWFSQCRIGSLAAVKEFSRYAKNKHLMKTIEERWSNVWNSALDLSNPSSEHRSVISHRDLWSNNLLFHYKIMDDGALIPDDCVLVDFQGVRCQPPAGDVMFLLHCNLTPQSRKTYFYELLDFYYNELKGILWNNGIDIHFVIPKEEFLKSAKEQNLWGLVMHAALVQVFWLDDDLTMEMFSDADMFQEILMEDRSTYIKAMMHKSEHYKQKMLETFEEFIDEYVLID